jgi:Icc protein
MPETLLRFVHITDTHISPDPDYNLDGAPHAPLIGAKALVDQLNSLPFTPDFVLHTGDVAYDPDPAAYPAAREILSQINAPCYYLAGNHDDSAALQRILLGHSDPKTPFDYEFEVNGVQIVCVDSNRPVEQPRGRVSDEQLAWLEGICRARDSRPLIVAVHHNALPMGTPWWDDFMRMVNGEAFHQALLPARERIRGVFFGHVHQSTETLRDGILHVSAPSSWTQILNNPTQVKTEYDPFGVPGFSVVTITREQTYIRRHTFAVT